MRAERDVESTSMIEHRRPKRSGAPDDWPLTFKENCWAAVGAGFLFFIKDWSGYNPKEPDLFFPRPLREVWWHLPVAVAFMLGVFQMARALDWAKDRPWPYWVATLAASGSESLGTEATKSRRCLPGASVQNRRPNVTRISRGVV